MEVCSLTASITISLSPFPLDVLMLLTIPSKCVLPLLTIPSRCTYAPHRMLKMEVCSLNAPVTILSMTMPSRCTFMIHSLVSLPHFV